MGIILTNALSINDSDYRSLILGRLLTWPTDFFMPVGQSFVLTTAPTSETQLVAYWGQCDQCQIIESAADLLKLGKLTGWNLDPLDLRLEEQGFILIAYLRIYQLVHPTELTIRKLVGFSPLDPVIIADNSNPVLSESIFRRRKQELVELLPPQHEELLQLEQLLLESNHSLVLNSLSSKIHQFLGWHSSFSSMPEIKFTWVADIAAIGNSSDGNGFEKIVRQSLVFLGFGNSIDNYKASLNPEATGGAGGLDFYGDTPYQIVGECKASKTDKVPDGTPAQLVKLGLKILGETYHQCIKILMVAGELTNAANQTAKGNYMNVIRPETLQKLVQLQAYYPGAIDLLALKSCLASTPFGEEANNKLNAFIEGILNDLQLRANIIKLVKDSLNRSGKNSESVEALYSIFTYTQADQKLSQQQFRDILVELSSPLTGYLGKLEEEQFYFLQSLDLSNKSNLSHSHTSPST
jgi:Domain of unknown function (DUF1802)